MAEAPRPACLSQLRRPLWDYCRQRFAEVTTPPIDPLRERHVMSLAVRIGAGTVLRSPLLDAGQFEDLRGLRSVETRGYMERETRHAASLPEVCFIDFTFPVGGGVESALAAVERVRAEA